MDPSCVLLLVIPSVDLMRDTTFGKKLLEIVEELIGGANMLRLGAIVGHAQSIFQGLQEEGKYPLRLEYGAWAMAGTRDQSMKCLKEQTRLKKGLLLPSVFQFLLDDGRRIFITYRNFQDAICDVYKRVLTGAPSQHVSCVEACSSPTGCIRLYVDVELYLEKLKFLKGVDRESMLVEIDTHMERLPRLLYDAYVSIGLFDTMEKRAFIIVDHTRGGECIFSFFINS